ncbi:MAG: hypothetical protein U0Q55_13025 [Vicinamibacterales bacterium]
MKTFAKFVACALLAGTSLGVSAQQPAHTPPPTYTPDIRYASGREVVPYLEGWIKNPDGTFDFVFGYFNRNTEQELTIPPGPDNMLSPGPADQGQPTYFMPRRQFRIFRVRVPKDFGDKSLTWSITANGKTEKVVARLVPAYEKDERFIATNNQTTVLFGEVDPNKPPSLTVEPIVNARVNAPVTLSAAVMDDGLPKPRVIRNDDPDRPREQVSDDPLARFRSQKNSSAPPRMQGLRVNWQVYRGTGKASLSQYVVPVSGGKAVTTARFQEPGTYVLVATAGDGKLNTQQRITIDVK